MKCSKCGANILTNDLICPYCGCTNEAGVKQKEHIQKLEEENLEFKEQVIEKNKFTIIFRIYKFVNLGLIGLFLIFLIITAIVATKVEKTHNISDSSKKAIQQYYDEGDLESLYLAMNDCDGFYDEDIPTEIKHVSLIYGSYLRMKVEYAESMNDYKENGTIRDYMFSGVIKYACQVYTGELSYLYRAEDLTDSAKAHISDMKTDAYDVLVGTFGLPPQMLDDIDLEDYHYYEVIEEYLAKEWCNEFD